MSTETKTSTDTKAGSKSQTKAGRDSFQNEQKQGAYDYPDCHDGGSSSHFDAV